MTALDRAMQLALSEIARHPGNAPVTHEPPPPGGYKPPVLPADLQNQVAILAGRARFKSPAGEADFVMRAEPAFHPHAARLVHEMRLAMQPAERETIEDWVVTLSAALINPPNDPEVLAFRVQVVARFCGELPGACWTEQTLMEAVDTFTHWPSVSEIKKLLRPHFEAMQRTLRALEAISEAKPAEVVYGNTEATEHYDPGPAPEERPPHPSMPKQDPPENAAEHDRMALLSRQRQFEALGLSLETVKLPEPRSLDAIYQASGRPNPRQRVANDG